MTKKTEAINNIMEQMVSITEYIDSNEVKTEYKNNKLINGLLKHNKRLFHYEYDEDIIRTEAYASILEGLHMAAEKLELPIEDISVKNEQLMCLAYNIAEYKMKEYLYPKSKSGHAKKSFTFIGDVEGELNKLSIDLFIEEKKDPELYTYIKRHKDKILTKKQCDYLNERIGYVPEKNKNEAEQDRKLRRRIEKRINGSLNNLRPAEALIHDRNTIIDSIVNADDFRAEYSKYQAEDFIIEAVLEIDSNTRRAFNKGSNDKGVIKKYKKALIKATKERE